MKLIKLELYRERPSPEATTSSGLPLCKTTTRTLLFELDRGGMDFKVSLPIRKSGSSYVNMSTGFQYFELISFRGKVRGRSSCRP